MDDAQRLKAERQRRGLTQTEMAELMGFANQPAIARVESEGRQLSGPARKLLEKLEAEAGKPAKS